MRKSDVYSFAVESNRIEGITTPSLAFRHAEALVEFLEREEVTIRDLQVFVHAVEPGAVLRDRPGIDVRVGDHHPPPGGPKIHPALEQILVRAQNNGPIMMSVSGDRVLWTPYEVHQQYETLHPFTDGNGRSGRALWAWQMLHENRWPGLRLGFLHCWYYQSLSASR